MTENQSYPLQQPPPLPPTNDECNIAMLAHLLAIFTGFLGPLVIYLVKKDESPFVRYNALNALNFQISLFIYSILGAVLILVFVGFFILFALGIIHIIFCVIGAVTARDGKVYRYPLTISFLK